MFDGVSLQSSTHSVRIPCVRPSLTELVCVPLSVRLCVCLSVSVCVCVCLYVRTCSDKIDDVVT